MELRRHYTLVVDMFTGNRVFLHVGLLRLAQQLLDGSSTGLGSIAMCFSAQRLFWPFAML